MKILKIKGGIYREVLFKIFRFYQTFAFYANDFPETEKGYFNEQLMVKIREEVGEQIIEDAEYGKSYIKWKREEEEKRKFCRIEELIKQKGIISESSPILLPSSSSSSSSTSSSPKLTQVNVMKDRLGGHYDPIRR
jgi:hypothetical protein